MRTALRSDRSIDRPQWKRLELKSFFFFILFFFVKTEKNRRRRFVAETPSRREIEWLARRHRQAEKDRRFHRDHHPTESTTV